jgi:surfeit locus 1 family protein
VIRFRPLLVMTACTLVALVILILLGDWQWARYQQKRAARTTPAATMTLSRFTPLPGRIQIVYGVSDAGPAWRIFAPVEHDGLTTFLDTGAIGGVRAPDWRAVAEPFTGADMAVKGLKVTPRPPSWAAARPDPGAHLWFAIDLSAMGRAANVQNVTPYYIALPYVGPTGALAPNPFADPRAADSLPPERHLGYALTWWGLAVGLIGVYGAFHVRAGRLGFGRPRADEHA